MYRIIDTLCQILVDELLDKISGYDLLLPVRNFNCIFFCVTHFLFLHFAQISLIVINCREFVKLRFAYFQYFFSYLSATHNKSHAEHGSCRIFSYEGGDSECFNYLSITIPNKCVKNVF